MNHKEQIALLQEKIRENRNRLSAVYRRIGRVYFDRWLSAEDKEQFQKLSEDKTGQRELLSCLERAENITTSSTDLGVVIEKIRESLERRKQINTQITEKERGIAALEEQNQHLFEPIGEFAYQAYLNNPERYGTYRQLFGEVDAIHERLSQLDRRESEELSNPKTNPLQNFIRKGMVMADQIKRNGVLKRLKVEHSRLGQEIVGSDFITEAKNPGLIEAASPVLKNKEEQASVQNEIEELQQELQTLLSFFQDVRKEYGASSPERAVSVIEKKIESADTLLEDELEKLGKLSAEFSAVHADAELSEYGATIESIESEHEGFNVLVKKHWAAIEYQDVTKRISQIDREKNSLEQIIAQKKKDLAELEKERKVQEIKKNEAKISAAEVLEEG